MTIATDAVGDFHPEVAENSLTHVFPRPAETGTTAEILAVLDETRP